MTYSATKWLFSTVAVLGCLAASGGCDKMSDLGGTGLAQTGGGGGDTSDGGETDGPSAASTNEAGATMCPYTDDKSFCACLQLNCGGATLPDNMAINRPFYCGSCPNDQFCQFTEDTGPGAGLCGGTNPLAYNFQKQKVDMLVSMGENDDPTVQYGYASNIGDGRGYTVGKAGFCTGTGDFIIVAECYNNTKPGNVLQKYWPGLVHYNDLYISTGNNQGDTSQIDSLGNFKADVATAAAEADGIFRGCQDSMSDALNLAPAAQHLNERGLQGPITAGFLYDTELNFGDDDDPGDPDAGIQGTAGAVTVMSRADKDYGPDLPKDFTGKAWEESKWLGYFIEERVKVMAADPTWKTDTDQNATWEGARRLHTGASNATESDTDLSMDYDFISKYKAGTSNGGGPCWTGLLSTLDTQSTIYDVSTDKTASATDETKWTATWANQGTSNYAACPTNPTP